jgi:hypothetical protein
MKKNPIQKFDSETIWKEAILKSEKKCEKMNKGDKGVSTKTS